MEDVVFNIARFQRELHGHRPSVITLDRVFRQNDQLPANETFKGIPIIRLAYRGSERYPLCPSVLKHLSDADVVHVHGVDFFYDFLAITRWWHRKPLLACTHGGFFHTPFAQRLKQLFFNTVTRFTSQGYQRILATSTNDGEIFSHIVHPDRLKVIENGVDVEKYADAASPTKVPTLIYFGRWSSNKGLLESLQLLRELRNVDADWTLIIAGREYDYSADQLRALSAELGVADAITLVSSPSDTELRELMQNASYFICLSKHEGFGLAAVEAMSAGLIPLLSEIPPYIKLAQETGVPLLLNDDPGGSAQTLLALHARNDDNHYRLRTQAQMQARHFSWRSVVDAYVAEYERAATPLAARSLT
jgi:alpha-1,3-mannosyltransferase